MIGMHISNAFLPFAEPLLKAGKKTQIILLNAVRVLRF